MKTWSKWKTAFIQSFALIIVDILRQKNFENRSTDGGDLGGLRRIPNLSQIC